MDLVFVLLLLEAQTHWSLNIFALCQNVAHFTLKHLNCRGMRKKCHQPHLLMSPAWRRASEWRQSWCSNTNTTNFKTKTWDETTLRVLMFPAWMWSYVINDVSGTQSCSARSSCAFPEFLGHSLKCKRAHQRSLRTPQGWLQIDH